jgi:hypothetical protein
MNVFGPSGLQIQLTEANRELATALSILEELVRYDRLEACDGPPARANAPGHWHTTPGVWDADNGPPRRARACAWCITWEEARHFVARHTNR